MMEKISNNSNAGLTLTVQQTKLLISQLERTMRAARNAHEANNQEQMELEVQAIINGVVSNFTEDYKLDDAGLMHINVDLKNSDVKTKPALKVKPFIPYEGRMGLKLKEYNTETSQAKCQIYKAENINPPSGSVKFTFVNLETELVFTVLSRMFPTVSVFVVKENVATVDIYQIQQIIGIDGEKVKSDLFVDDICDACPISKQVVIDNIGFSKKSV